MKIFKKLCNFICSDASVFIGCVGCIVCCVIFIVFREFIDKNANALTALGTCGAVFISLFGSLFGDKINQYRKAVKLEIDTGDKKKIGDLKVDDLLDEVLDEDTKINIKTAIKYSVKLPVINASKKNVARNVICCIEKICCIGESGECKKLIEFVEDEVHLNWLKKDGICNIYQLSKFYVSLLEILNPTQAQRMSKSDLIDPTNDEENYPILKVGENNIPIKFHNEKIKICFFIVCENSKIKRYTLTFKWDGKWETRLKEFKNHIALKVEEREL